MLHTNNYRSQHSCLHLTTSVHNFDKHSYCTPTSLGCRTHLSCSIRCRRRLSAPLSSLTAAVSRLHTPLKLADSGTLVYFTDPPHHHFPALPRPLRDLSQFQRVAAASVNNPTSSFSGKPPANGQNHRVSRTPPKTPSDTLFIDWYQLTQEHMGY